MIYSKKKFPGLRPHIYSTLHSTFCLIFSTSQSSQLQGDSLTALLRYFYTECILYIHGYQRFTHILFKWSTFVASFFRLLCDNHNLWNKGCLYFQILSLGVDNIRGAWVLYSRIAIRNPFPLVLGIFSSNMIVFIFS